MPRERFGPPVQSLPAEVPGGFAQQVLVKGSTHPDIRMEVDAFVQKIKRLRVFSGFQP
jgi:hypothetical protein